MSGDRELRSPSDLGEEIVDCVLSACLDLDETKIDPVDRQKALDYISDMITGDRELILRRFLNGRGR